MEDLALVVNDSNPNKCVAERFLKQLDPVAKGFTFQTFDDLKGRNNPSLTKVLHGTLDEHWDALASLNIQGAGVFITVNETNFSGRTTQDMVNVRAMFREDDTGGLPDLPLKPQMVVESSPGKKHEYLLTNKSLIDSEGGLDKDAVEEFDGVLRRVIEDYGSDPCAKSVTRVLRVPGFWHRKDPDHPHLVKIVELNDESPYSWEEIKAALPPVFKVKPEQGIRSFVHKALVASALENITDYSYETWAKVGAALGYQYDHDGFELFHTWSKKDSSGYKGQGDCLNAFQSFVREEDAVTIRAIFHLAKEGGWDGSIDPDIALTYIPSPSTKSASCSTIAEMMSHSLSDQDTVIGLLMDREGWKSCKGSLKQMVRKAANKCFSSRDIKPVDRVLEVHENIGVQCFPDARLTNQGVSLQATKANLEVLLAAYGIRCSYDIIKKNQSVIIPSEQACQDLQDNANYQSIISLCNKNNLPPGTADNLVNAIAKNTTNPVLDWVQGKAWDGTDRFEQMCQTIHVRPGYEAIKPVVMKIWFLQSIAALDAGEHSPRDDALPKYEYILVFQGLGGANKTDWILGLLPRKLSDYIKISHHLAVGNKDSEKEAISYWITELGELDSTFRKSDISRMKAFTSRTHDSIRLPYERKPNNYPRRTSFIGSVNPFEFLMDETGNRRYLPLAVITAEPKHKVDLQQFWAQIHHEYLQGAQWWPTHEQDKEIFEVSRQHQSKDLIVLQLEEMFYLEYIDPEGCELFSAKDIVLELLGEAENRRSYNNPKPDNKQLRAVSNHLAMLGFNRFQRSGINKFKIRKKHKLYPWMLAVEGPKIEAYCVINVNRSNATRTQDEWRNERNVECLRDVRKWLKSGDVGRLDDVWKKMQGLGPF